MRAVGHQGVYPVESPGSRSSCYDPVHISETYRRYKISMFKCLSSTFPINISNSLEIIIIIIPKSYIAHVSAKRGTCTQGTEYCIQTFRKIRYIAVMSSETQLFSTLRVLQGATEHTAATASSQEYRG